MESRSFPFSEKYSSYMFSAGRKRLLSVSSLVMVSSSLLILALIFQYFSFNLSVLQPLFHSFGSTTTTTSSNHTDIKNVSDYDVGKTHEEMFSNGSKDASLLSSYIGEEQKTHVGGSVDDKILGESSVGDMKNDSSSGETQGQPPQCSIPENSNADAYERCDIYKGKWVRDEKKPYHPVGSCPHIDKGFNCHAKGRPDDDYLKWRWQPDDCNIPSFNATDFLERSRGKNITFVGDSQNRNMWKSLVCMLRHGVTNTTKVHKIYGKNYFIGFIYEDYNCSVQYVSAPFLVRETSVKLENGTSPTETLRLDLMHKKSEAFNEADVIVFNTGQWWNYDKTSKGENYYQEGTYLYPKLDVLKAFHKALITWGKWVDENVNTSRTQVIFRGYSFTHFRDGQWNSGGQCHKETEPNFNDTSLRKYPTKMKIVENVLKQMKTPVIYMNVSRLTDYRQDGHPSIYRMEYKIEEERAAAMHSQDCSHWCLPGVPDTWNELMYASLLKFGKGPWTN